MEEKTVLLTIAYDGTNFSGWQRQPGKPTIQGELENVLSLLCRAPIKLEGTSRTDAGVHALGQRASFSGNFGIPVEKIPLAASHLLMGPLEGSLAPNFRGSHGAIQIIKAEQVQKGFHARFNAKGKTYYYEIETRESPDIFRRNYCYNVSYPLDLQAMAEAGQVLVGTHDFKSFQASGGEEKETTVRTIHSLKVEKTQNGLRVQVSGDGFLYNMVRIIVGTLVDIGRGKIRSQVMEEILLAKDRQRAGHTAPPQGLYLAEVHY